MFTAQKTAQEGEGAAESKNKEEAKIVTTLKGSMGERITKALAKVEEKKRKRAARRAQVNSLSFIEKFAVCEIYKVSFFCAAFILS